MSWKHIRGHETLIKTFEHVWRRGRMAHAYLFVGPPGVGKRLFARELAKALLCEARPDPDRLEACDHCAACALVGGDTHPDLVMVGRPEESNELPIELMRELTRGFGLKPAHGHGKVAIVDDADDLNDASANCFLKTLEEPPPKSVLILIGTSKDRQLRTIVSRCQVVTFAPLADALVADLLREQGVEGDDLIARLTRLSAGSPGQALAFADPALWSFRSDLLAELAQPMPDTVGLAKRWMQFVEEAGKELAAQRRRAGLVVRLLVLALRDALAIKMGGSPRLASSEEADNLRRLAEPLNPEQLMGLIERCLEADYQIGLYVQLSLVLEGLMDALGQQLRDQAHASAGPRT